MPKVVKLKSKMTDIKASIEEMKQDIFWTLSQNGVGSFVRQLGHLCQTPSLAGSERSQLQDSQDWRLRSLSKLFQTAQRLLFANSHIHKLYSLTLVMFVRMEIDSKENVAPLQTLFPSELNMLSDSRCNN